MTLGELLDDLRHQYLTDLVATLQRLEAESGAELVGEPALRTSGGVVARDGPWELPCRVDAAMLVNGAAHETIRVDGKVMGSFRPVEFGWSDSMAVSVHPFQWDYCHVRFSPPGNIGGPLKEWFTQWFDEEDTRDVSPDGLQGVVHFMSDLELSATDGHVAIDFGSAPVEAVEALLDVLAHSGVATVRVGGP